MKPRKIFESMHNSVSNPAAFIQSIDRMRELMMLGWMRRMLKRASHEARERGYKRIDVEQLVLLDPFE